LWLLGAAVASSGIFALGPAAPALSSTTNCSQTSTGNVAIPDLGTGTYQGEQGGLYPGGSNVAPPAYRSAGVQAGQSVVPLDTSGNASAAGNIVFLSVGMSNTAMEFQFFARNEASDSLRNPAVAFVDGAQADQPASAWTLSGDPTWAVVEQRLAARGFTDQQVEAIWLKQADAKPQSSFETYAHGLQQELGQIIQVATQRYPNLRQVFVSSRSYGGYGPDSANPEPYAYETGFADEFLIAQWVANPSQRPGPMESSGVRTVSSGTAQTPSTAPIRRPPAMPR
jgi:hypothetical protein